MVPNRIKDKAMLSRAEVEIDSSLFCLLSIICLFGLLVVVPPAAAWRTIGHQDEDLLLSAARYPLVHHSLRDVDCAPLPNLPIMLGWEQDEIGDVPCDDLHRAPGADRMADTHRDTDTEQEPGLRWRSVDDTQKLHPTAAPSVGISWYGTFDGEVSTLNFPIVGTTLVAVRKGLFNFDSSVGVGVGGLYLQAGISVPAYYKYPRFWSLNLSLGTAYNLGFFLEPRWKSTGFWGGGPEFILELGLLRVHSLLSFGVATTYCTKSFMCDVGPGLLVSLGISLIEETTGLPSQR